MASSKNRNRKFFLFILAGTQLMCFALFLHPMNPEDFLWLAMTEPAQTIDSQYGLAMAIVFWLSLLLIVIGVIGWIGCNGKLANLRRANNRSVSSFWHTR